MARPRIDLETADVTGQSDRWTPEQRAAREEAERAKLTDDQRSEVAKLDALIADAMKACTRGQKIRGRRNPAFQNLQVLVRARKLIFDTKRPKSQASTEEAIAKIDAMIAEAEKVN